METFGLLKFWKSTTAKGAAGTTTSEESLTVVDSAVSNHFKEESDGDDDDDSFFELELTLPKLHSKSPKTGQERESEPKPTSKPQSPISILRAAPPKLRVFMFGKLKKPKRNDFEMDSVFSPERCDSSLFTVKFRIEDGSIVPKVTRFDSSEFTSPRNSYELDESSKRFSKDVVQRYLNRIKPLYTRSPKKLNDSTASFPFKMKRKRLSKSKAALKVIGAPSPASFPGRSDHSHDVIEGAILHCKLSLNSSKGYSRCSSDPLHDKSIQVPENI